LRFYFVFFFSCCCWGFVGVGSVGGVVGEGVVEFVGFGVGLARVLCFFWVWGGQVGWGLRGVSWGLAGVCGRVGVGD